MASVSCDVAVIGSGPGGYVCAIRASQLGARVAIIEKDELGGTCLNRGCIPTKALLQAVELIDLQSRAQLYGIKYEAPKIDFKKMMARKEAVVKTLRSGVASLMKSNSIEVIKGTGVLKAPHEVRVSPASGEEVTVRAKKIIVASGSVPAMPPIPGIEAKGTMTSDDVLNIDFIPASIAIIGAGALGVEFGVIFAGLGSKVTLIEMLPQVIPTEDADLSAHLSAALKKQGLTVLTSAQVRRVEDAPKGGKALTIAKNGAEEKIEAEMVLLGAGRKPAIFDLGLDNLGANYDKKGISVNSRFETSVPDIYAIGDAIGGYLLAHVAQHEGMAAAENALGNNSSVNYSTVPRCIYTSPEVAAVGLTEREAIEQGYKVKVGKFNFAANGKALIMGEREGFVKIVADETLEEILGVHIVGPRATELLPQAVVAMSMEATLEELSTTMFPHPTLSESVMESALSANGRAIHMPPRSLK